MFLSAKPFSAILPATLVALCALPASAFAQSALPPQWSPGAIMQQEFNRRSHPEIYSIESVPGRVRPGKQAPVNVRIDRSRVDGQVLVPNPPTNPSPSSTADEKPLPSNADYPAKSEDVPQQ